MNTDTSLFSPLGPLAYLVMDQDQQALLGLYQYTATGQTIVMVAWKEKAVCCWVSGFDLDALMECRKSVSKVLEKVHKTYVDLRPLSRVDAFLFSIHCALHFDEVLARLEDCMVHPNYFYTFKQHQFNAAGLLRRQ